jgi:hypothetical protein
MNEPPELEECVGDDPLAQAEQLLEDARQSIFELIAEIKTGKSELAKQLQPALAEFRRATWTIFDERKRAHEARKRDSGIVYDYALDLEKSRSEIEQRLDRIRAAHSPAGVPEQPGS